MYIYMYIHTNIRIYIYICVYMYIYMYVYVYVYMCIYIHVYLYTSMCVYICVCIYKVNPTRGCYSLWRSLLWCVQAGKLQKHLFNVDFAKRKEICTVVKGNFPLAERSAHANCAVYSFRAWEVARTVVAPPSSIVKCLWGCLFGGLGCCSCRVWVCVCRCRGWCSLCVCDLLIFLHF